MESIQVNSPDDLPEVAQAILDHLQGRHLVAFRGPMGAGKTTLIRAICEQLGVTDTVTSPTFALINEYKDAQGEPVYHFDFYRIEKLEEAFDFGYEEYFFSDHLCLVEWPEKIESLLPDEGVMHVVIEILDKESRRISFD